MPYIEKKRREEMDSIICALKEKDVQANGDLNYVLYRFCLEYVKPSYNDYKNFLGELRQCCSEIERRILSKYEDKKIIENGDIIKKETNNEDVG